MSVYNLENINDDLFYYYPTPLFEHSMREWKNKEKMNEGMLNHFSERISLYNEQQFDYHISKVNL